MSILALAGEPAQSCPARSWGSSGDCIAAAVLVHGLGAHSGWFEALGRRLKVRRIFALAYDQVGFGKRKGQTFVSKEQWFSDLSRAFAFVKETVGDKPVFVMGNSMGAAVSLRAVADRLVAPAGLVMFSPGFDGNPELFKLSYRVAAVVKALLKPESEIELPYTPDMVTRTESVRTWINCDPDRRFSPTGRMMLELLKLSLTLPKIRSVECPLYMFRPAADTIVDGKASLKLFDQIVSPSKKEQTFPEAWHDLMFDPVIDELSDELASWIKMISNKTAAKPDASPQTRPAK